MVFVRRFEMWKWRLNFLQSIDKLRFGGACQGFGRRGGQRSRRWSMNAYEPLGSAAAAAEYRALSHVHESTAL